MNASVDRSWEYKAIVDLYLADRKSSFALTAIDQSMLNVSIDQSTFYQYVVQFFGVCVCCSEIKEIINIIFIYITLENKAWTKK